MNNQEEYKESRGSGRRFDQEGTKPREISPGRWNSVIMLGYKPDGSRNRVSVTEDSPQAVISEVARLRRDYRAGKTVTMGASTTLSAWVNYYLDRAESLDLLAPNTISGYRGKTRPYVDETRLGKIPLRKLQAQHVEAQYRKMLDDGLSVATIKQLHAILSTSLELASQRGHIGDSPMTHVSVPRVGREVKKAAGVGDALTIDEAQQVLETAKKSVNYPRWMFGLLLGIRQAEVLAVDWDEAIDLDAGTVTLFRSLYRKTWKHGCQNSAGETTCQGKRGADCPARFGGGLFVGGVKSEASDRVIPLPGVVVSALRDQKQLHDLWAVQDGVRSTWTAASGEVLDLVFKQRNGRPVDPRRDWGEWKDLLAEAGVDPVRVHDMRHTAATMLLIQGVDSRVVMEIMGWSQVSMLTRYQHVVEHLQRDALDKVAGALESKPAPAASSGVVVGLEAWKKAREG